MSILGQMWALVANKQKIVNKKMCDEGKKWQFQDNFFSLPDAELASGEAILEISVPNDGEHFFTSC